MAQFDRTKKLTDVAYSPVNAISEATRRAEVDGSIQEIADILYSTASGKGASQVGLEGGAYANVQLLSAALQDVVTGFVPLDLSVTNAKLATDVKVGSLATLLTTTKASVVAAINELVTSIATKANKAQEVWIEPTLLNSWVNFDTVNNSASYFKDEFGIVHIRGFVKSGAITSVIFTLPVGYRPLKQSNFPSVSIALFGYAIVFANGNVVAQVGNTTNFSLDGIQFKAEA